MPDAVDRQEQGPLRAGRFMKDGRAEKGQCHVCHVLDLINGGDQWVLAGRECQQNRREEPKVIFRLCSPCQIHDAPGRWAGADMNGCHCQP